MRSAFGETAFACLLTRLPSRSLERETGIEPATNSLEGCDSTTELLPPSRLARFASLGATAGKPAVLFIPFSRSLRRRASRRLPFHFPPQYSQSALSPSHAKVGGEGRTRTFEGAGPTDLQSAAFDRFATSPMLRPHISATAERAPAGRRLRGFVS